MEAVVSLFLFLTFVTVALRVLVKLIRKAVGTAESAQTKVRRAARAAESRARSGMESLEDRLQDLSQQLQARQRAVEQETGVLERWRTGTCTACGEQYRLPEDFPTNLARCEKCAGIVQVEGRVESQHEDSQQSPRMPGLGIEDPQAGEGLSSSSPIASSPTPHQVEDRESAAAPPAAPPTREEPSAPGPVEGAPLEDSLALPADAPRSPIPPAPEPPTMDLADAAAAPPANAPTVGEPPVETAKSATFPETFREGTGLLEVLADRSRLGSETREAVERELGTWLRLEGHVLRQEGSGHDSHFKGAKGHRLVVEASQEGTRFIALLPLEAVPPSRGEAVEVRGQLVGVDPYLRALFLAPAAFG